MQSLVTKAWEGASGSRGVLPSQAATWSRAAHRVPGAPARSTPWTRSGCVQVWQRHSRGGGRDTRGEHKTGINDAVKVPKKAVVPFGVPAVPGIQQHRSILIEYTKLRLKHTHVLSRIY